MFSQAPPNRISSVARLGSSVRDLGCEVAKQHEEPTLKTDFSFYLLVKEDIPTQALHNTVLHSMRSTSKMLWSRP